MLDSGVTPAQYEAILDNFMVKSPLVFVDLSATEFVDSTFIGFLVSSSLESKKDARPELHLAANPLPVAKHCNRNLITWPEFGDSLL